MDYATLAARLPEIAAKRVILTHFGPCSAASRAFPSDGRGSKTIEL